MGNPSAFEIGRTVSNNLGNSFQKTKDNSAIESILSEAMQSGDPKVFQNSIAKMLSQVSPERQGPAIQYLQNVHTNLQQKQQQAKLETEGRAAAQEGKYTYGAPKEVQAAQVRNQSPPKPAGGLSGQAVPPEVTEALNNVVTNNADANADQLALAFDKARIPRTYSNSYIENRRRQDETKAGNIREDTKIGRKEILDFHKESKDYDEDLMKQARIAKSQASTLKTIEKAVESGNIKPSSWSNIFKGFGKIGDKISEALLNEDEATLLTSIPQLLEGWKDVFGVRLTDADLRVLQDKIPSIGKNPAANKAVMNILKKYSEMTLLRGQIAEKIKADNKGLRPLSYASAVEKRFDEMTAPVKIINPRNGNEIDIPAYKLSEAMEAGAILADLGKEFPAEEEVKNEQL